MVTYRFRGLDTRWKQIRRDLKKLSHHRFFTHTTHPSTTTPLFFTQLRHLLVELKLLRLYAKPLRVVSRPLATQLLSALRKISTDLTLLLKQSKKGITYGRTLHYLHHRLQPHIHRMDNIIKNT